MVKTKVRIGETKELRRLPMPHDYRSVADDREPRLAALRILARRFQHGSSLGGAPEPSFYDGYRCRQVLDAVQNITTSGNWTPTSSSFVDHLLGRP